MKRFEIYKTPKTALKALDRFCAQKGECENCPYSDDRAYMPYTPGEPTYNCAVRFLYDRSALMKLKIVKLKKVVKVKRTTRIKKSTRTKRFWL